MAKTKYEMNRFNIECLYKLQGIQREINSTLDTNNNSIERNSEIKKTEKDSVIRGFCNGIICSAETNINRLENILQLLNEVVNSIKKEVDSYEK